MRYKVLVECRSDKTGKRYEPGQIIPGNAFPSDVIENWLKINVLQLFEEESELKQDGREEQTT